MYEQHETTSTNGSIDGLTRGERGGLPAPDRRRRVLEIISERSASVELGDLAAEVAEREHGRDDVTVERVTNVEISLHHVHLPVLAEIGVLEYDPESHRIDPETNSDDRYPCV